MKLVFYLFISIYCLIKNLLGIPPGFVKENSFPVGLLIQSCLITLSIITMLSLGVVMLTIQIFLWGMDLWLMWKLGNNYGGRLEGQDATFECLEEKLSISCMAILNYNEDHTILNKRLQEMFTNIHNSSYKLSCTVKRCLGYTYYVKNQVTSDDCCVFTKVNDKRYITRDELFEHIQKNYMLNICNKKRLWYGRIFTQPVLWNKQSETRNQIAVMLNIRHCIADGPSLLWFLEKFMTREEQPELMKLEPTNSTRYNFSFDDAYFYKNLLTCRKDESTFGITNNERHVVFYIEDETKYVPLVKRLKNKIRKGFSEILVAGFTASLAKVLAKRGKSMDKCTTTVMFGGVDEDLVNIHRAYNYNNLTNNASLVMINSPVTMREGSTLLDRLKSIGIELEQAKHSIDRLAYYTASKFLHILPAPILRHCVMLLWNITAGVSNVGGFKTVKLADCEAEALMAFTPFFYKTCFRLHVFSYGDRFQLALTIRENIMYSREDAQEVIDNIFTFIDNLCEELNIQ